MVPINPFIHAALAPQCLKYLQCSIKVLLPEIFFLHLFDFVDEVMVLSVQSLPNECWASIYVQVLSCFFDDLAAFHFLHFILVIYSVIIVALHYVYEIS